MKLTPQFMNLIRDVVQNTGQTFRFCLILFCVGVFSRPGLLTLIGALLLEVIRR